MKINDVRRANLKRLVDRYGTREDLAHKLDVTPGWIGQLLTARRAFTEKTARKFEHQLHLADGWLDQCRVQGFLIPSPAYGVRDGDEADNLLDRIPAACRADLMRIITHAVDMAISPEDLKLLRLLSDRLSKTP